ncbi:MAG: hypothetical protein FDW93_06475 [Bergeyella sp.]|nr:hypothetical protein [Bergeyella sp.]
MAFVFRWVSVIFGSLFFSYLFIERSIDRFQKDGVGIQLINTLPQTLDFYIIVPSQKENKTEFYSKHIGSIRTDYYRLDHFRIKNSDTYWVAGFMGENLAYLSSHQIPNKNMDQVIRVDTYSIAGEDSMAELSRRLVAQNKANDRHSAVWITYALLLLFINLALLIKTLLKKREA